MRSALAPTARLRSPAAGFLGSFGPFFLFALLVLVGLLLVGDYYYVTYDEFNQRNLAAATLLHVSGMDDTLLQHYDRTYGVAFELPLLFVELLLGLEELQSIYLTRRLLTHLFFLVGGLFCYLLVRRMGGGRVVALFAMLLFLLHPRLYAHSFFNTKDLPFLSMFMIALFLIHRAFRKDDFAAFISCGMAVGVLTNIRILGMMLFVAVLGIRLLDLLYAADGRERKRILITIGLFFGASTLILYATWPYLWSDPIGRFAEAFRHMAHHPELIYSLFQGEVFHSGNLPSHYIPTWLSITTPAITLALGGFGLLSVLRNTLGNLGAVLRNGAKRFELLLFACFALPMLAVAVLDSHLYNGWRQMYFIYAPFALLAAIGLSWLVSFAHGNATQRLGAYGLVGAGLMATVAQMAAMHPNQGLYFNFLVDRTTPERLRRQYDLDYYGTLLPQGLRTLLERRPAATVNADLSLMPAQTILAANLAALPKVDQQRLQVDFSDHADFYITNHQRHIGLGRRASAFPPSIYDFTMYNNTVLSLLALNLAEVDEVTAKPYRDLHRSLVASEPVVRAHFDVHLRDRTLYYVKEKCRPLDTRAYFMLHIVPMDEDDLLERRRRYGFADMEFPFGWTGVRFDGNCLAAMRLPNYDIARITIGQSIPGINRFRSHVRCYLWKEDILFNQRQEARHCVGDLPSCPAWPIRPCDPRQLPAS